MKPVDKTGTLRFKVDWPELAIEIATHSEVKNSPGAIMGMQLLNKSLYRIGKRAIEIDDAIILQELEAIGVLEPITTDAT